MYNYNLAFCDTDSITFSKPDGSEFSKEDQIKLNQELNNLFPERIHWEPNFYAEKLIVLKAKNYAIWDGKTLKVKGSALKSSTKEPALKNLVKDIIQTILDEKYDYSQIYLTYIKQCMNIKLMEVMRPWCSKKTVTERTIKSTRANETKVMDALGDKPYQEGDKNYFFFKQDGSLCLIENWDGDYDQYKLMEKVWKTMKTFENIIDMKQFEKYFLKTKRKLLEEIK